MNTEDEHNYKGHPMEIVEVVDFLGIPKGYRVFSRDKFLASGFSREYAIKQAERQIDKKDQIGAEYDATP